ncbi:MAG: carboxypeptidase regulatory-like domain-containing protein [Clostridiales bacterium]|nr:carboxypeptidase regulatory-like domain-containing protein [Clostridiales bacterium]
MPAVSGGIPGTASCRPCPVHFIFGREKAGFPETGEIEAERMQWKFLHEDRRKIMRCPNCGSERPKNTKFCGKCGFRLDGTLCPNCGSFLPSGARRCEACGTPLDPKTKPPARKRKGWKIALIVVLCLALAVGGVVGGIFVYQSTQADSGEEASYDNLLILDDTFTDRTVTDEATAILAAQDAAESLGLQNAMEELEPLNTTEAYGDSYYRLQQYYQGYPVYGRAVVVLADENGEALNLVGNVADVDEGLSFTPSVTQTELEESLSAYAVEELELSGEVSLEEASDDALVIYDLYDEETHLAYELSASLDGELYTVILDANDGEVLLAYETLSNASITGTNSSGTVAVDAAVGDENEDTYYLFDRERKIRVFDLDGTSGSKHTLGESVFSNETNANGEAVFPDDAVNYLSTLSRIYDTYENWGIDNIYPICANYRDGDDLGMSAMGGVAEIDGGKYGLISVGSVTGTSDIDVLAHEYAHYIMISYIGKLSSDFGKAIEEGFSDIFGCLVECKLNGWEDPDWRITQDADIFLLLKVDRDIANPQNTHNKVSWDGSGYKFTILPVDEYTYSTIISHSAYLMWTGNNGVGALSVDELAELWYRAMLMFPADCDFYNVRQLVLQAGSGMDLTSAQMECIKWTFNEVGIGSTWNVGNQVAIAVKDSEGNPYDDYTITITKEGYFFEGLLNGGAYDATYLWDTTDLFAIELKDGTYTVTIIDNANSEKEQTLTLEVGESSSNQTVNIYNYGAEYTVAPGATLTVLNEAGQPITDFTVSAEYEDETFEINPDSIDLEEKNYYTVTITVEDEEEVYMTIFTLRIKDSDGAADSLSIRTGVKSSKGSFYATVVDASDGTTPISGATMSIIDEGGSLIETLTSDENGAFEAELPRGTYTVQIEMDGYDAVEFTVSVDAQEDVDAGEIVMTPTVVDRLEYEMREEEICACRGDGSVYYEHTVTYPYFLGNSAVASLLNQRYSEKISAYKNSMPADGEDAYQEWADDRGGVMDEDMLPFYENLTAEVCYNRNGAISIKETYEYWTGGAHIYRSEEGVNWDLHTGESLTYLDILAGTDQQRDNAIKYYLDDAGIESSTNYEHELSTVKEYTAYTLCEEGLCFYYNYGDAVPRVEVTIPFTDDTTWEISLDALDLDVFRTELYPLLSSYDAFNQAFSGQLTYYATEEPDAEFKEAMEESGMGGEIAFYTTYCYSGPGVDVEFSDSGQGSCTALTLTNSQYTICGAYVGQTRQEFLKMGSYSLDTVGDVSFEPSGDTYVCWADIYYIEVFFDSTGVICEIQLYNYL